MLNRHTHTSALKGNMKEHASRKIRKRNKSVFLFFILVLVSCGILLVGSRQFFLLTTEQDQKNKKTKTKYVTKYTKKTKTTTMRGADSNLKNLAKASSNNFLDMKKDYPASYRQTHYNKLPSKHVAVIIVNYNMPERTNDLVIQIKKTKWPVDIIVVDNGSDLKEPSRHTLIFLETNVQTCHGWLMGLHYADALAANRKEEYFAYWMMITSAHFPSQHDVLTTLARTMEVNPNAVMVHPALTEESTTQWNHMKRRGTENVRKTWMVDNIANLVRADWFDSIGRFDGQLTYAWGVDVETSYKAREQNRDILIVQNRFVGKVTDIAYKMGRMNMKGTARRSGAREEVCDVYRAKYGDVWYDKLFYNPEGPLLKPPERADKLVTYWHNLCSKMTKKHVPSSNTAKMSNT